LNLGLNDKVIGAATGNSNDVYGILTATGHFKRISFSSLEQTVRTTKGQKVLNLPKRKIVNLISSFKANDKININLLTNKEK